MKNYRTHRFPTLISVFLLLSLPAFAGLKKDKAVSTPAKPAAATPAPKQEPRAEMLTGTVYALDSDLSKPLYRYERKLVQEGPLTKVGAEYHDLDGKLLYREDYVFRGKELLNYEFDQKQVGDKGSAKVDGKKVSMSFTEEGDTKTKEKEDDGVLFLPAMIAGLVDANWDKLMNGDSIDARLILIERLDTVGFSFKKKKDLNYHGKDAVQITMKPSSFIIASIVNPIQLTFDKNTHRLLESAGRLPLRVPKWDNPKKRGDWKAMDGVLVLNYN